MDPGRLVHRAVEQMYHRPTATPGDLLSDAPYTKSWRELLMRAANRDAWRELVRKLQGAPQVTVSMGTHIVAEQTVAFTISS